MLKALVTAEITGADIPGTLDRLNAGGITLLALVPLGELSVQVTVLRQEYPECERIVRKRGDCISLKSRRGLYWAIRGLLARPVLLLGMALILAVSLYLPSRVLFVRVEGNRLIPSRKILEIAEECGIGFGASRRAVRSERMKNHLQEALPELQWAGVNTRGVVAVITVRERPEQEEGQAQAALGHIVALTDGVVTQCTVTRGNLLCAPGEAVKKGQILISGYTDTGLTIRAELAAGEIFATTRRQITAVTGANCLRKSSKGQERKKFSLLLGKKRIIFWNSSRIWDTTCDRMYEEYYITLPGGFALPIGLAVERFVPVETVQQEIPQADGQLLLSTFGANYLKQTMIAGTIHLAQPRYFGEPGLWIMAGEYRCTELIGVQQRFQIGEENE